MSAAVYPLIYLFVHLSFYPSIDPSINPFIFQMYGMIHLLHLDDVFTKLELATLMTACVCHDIDHPGFNNK